MSTNIGTKEADDDEETDPQTLSDQKTLEESALDEVQTAMVNLFPGGVPPLNSSLSSSFLNPSSQETDSTVLRRKNRNTHRSTSSSDPTSAFEPNLLTLLQSYDWLGALSRVQTHPFEAALVGAEGRVPLHVACDLDAPAVVVKAILQAYPNAATMVGTSAMTPLHITCSSAHASVEVVQVLLFADVRQNPWGVIHVETKDPTVSSVNKTAWNEKFLFATSMKDVDGDTPLHAACRCGAPLDVVEILLSANASVVHERDREGLTPLLRLWVRYFVSLGEETIQAITDLQGPIFKTVFYGTELWGAWEKTLLLLRAAYFTFQQSFHPHLHISQVGTSTVENPVFRAVHAAATYDCPRLVLKLATLLYPHQLSEMDHFGYTPLMIAACTPVYKVHNLGGDGYEIDDQLYGDVTEGLLEVTDKDSDNEPSVIDIILSASSPDMATIPHRKTQRLPLILAIVSGKRWNEGLKSLLNAYPEALLFVDPITGLYPFMLAATIGTGKETVTGSHSDRFSFHESHKADVDISTIYELLRCDPEAIWWGNRNAHNGRNKV